MLSDASFTGTQTGQSCLKQFFQCEMIARDEPQWTTAGSKRDVHFSLCTTKNFITLTIRRTKI